MRPYLDSSTACTIATLSFTPNSITVILSTINSPSLNYPVSSRSRTLLLVLSSKLPWSTLVIPLPSYARPIDLHTGSGSLNASNTSSSHLPTKFSQLTQPPYLHNLISIQRPRSTRSSSVVIIGHLSKITDRSSFRYASSCLWNQLPFSLRQLHSGTSSSTSYSPIPSPIGHHFFLFF